MSAEEAKGFVIHDRRGRAEEGQTPLPSEPGSDPSHHRTETTSSAQPSPAPELGHPVTFSSFVFSLGTSALMLMGEQLDPQQRQPPVNLAQAEEIIDILSMLDTKTRGNLTSEEQAVLVNMLYALRMKYVDLASGKPATKSS